MPDSPLKPTPYRQKDSRNLWHPETFTHVTYYKNGKWIVSRQGRSMGSLRKRRAKGQVGWDLDPIGGSGQSLERKTLEEVAEWLDQHHAATGEKLT